MEFGTLSTPPGSKVFSISSEKSACSVSMSSNKINPVVGIKPSYSQKQTTELHESFSGLVRFNFH